MNGLVFVSSYFSFLFEPPRSPEVSGYTTIIMAFGLPKPEKEVQRWSLDTSVAVLLLSISNIPITSVATLLLHGP